MYLNNQSFFIELVLVFVLGCCIGSFINVILYRFPKNQSILFPRSFCPKCKSKIKWFDNIPIFSWIFLRAKCRQCNNPITLQYPFVELLYGLIGTYSFYKVFENKYSFLEVIYVILLTTILLSLSLIDIDHYWVPDSFCKILIIIGIVSNLFSNNLFCTGNIVQAIYRIFLSLVFYYLIKTILFLQERKFKIKLIGMGDIKLYSINIIWFGLAGLLTTFLISIYLALIVVLFGRFFRNIKPMQKIPFVPYISVGMWLTYIFGSKFWIDIWLNFGSSINNIFI